LNAGSEQEAPITSVHEDGEVLAGGDRKIRLAVAV
jgi:hypothetical protein